MVGDGSLLGHNETPHIAAGVDLDEHFGQSHASPLPRKLETLGRRIAKGHERIALQHEIIAELDREGHDTVPARELLATFENTQAMHVANRDRIAGKLATLDLDYRPWPARPRP